MTQSLSCESTRGLGLLNGYPLLRRFLLHRCIFLVMTVMQVIPSINVVRTDQARVDFADDETIDRDENRVDEQAIDQAHAELFRNNCVPLPNNVPRVTLNIFESDQYHLMRMLN
jgi:hypothetical protein